MCITALIGAAVGAVAGATIAVVHGDNPLQAQFWEYTAAGAAAGAIIGFTGGAASGAAAGIFGASAATASAVGTAATVGAGVGAYYGAAKANGTYNPFDFNLSSTKTLEYMAAGDVIGGVIGAGSAAGGIVAGAAVGGGEAGAVIGGATAGGLSGSASGWAYGGGDKTGFFQGSARDIVWGGVAGAIIGGAAGYVNYAKPSIDLTLSKTAGSTNPSSEIIRANSWLRPLSQGINYTMSQYIYSPLITYGVAQLGYPGYSTVDNWPKSWEFTTPKIHGKFDCEPVCQDKNSMNEWGEFWRL
jgi:hypothetical protein